jgi:hypothetical protein
MAGMSNEAEQLVAEAMKRVGLSGSFSPSEVGAKIGLTKPQAEAAARALSNAGVLVLGFDCAAHFSTDYRKLRAVKESGAARGKKQRSAKGKATASAAR